MTGAFGIIGGSGFYTALADTTHASSVVETPFGPTSGPVTCGELAGRPIVFVPRHGPEHGLLPAEINARANIWALKRAGATHVVSVSAVGSLREHIAPGDVVVPRQLIDRTMGRPSTFFGRGAVAHVSLADPVCARLTDELFPHAREHGPVHDGGTYVCIEGPQFSTRAESELLRSWGADVVGMTNLPEARLAREAELCYAILALPTDYDCWRPRSEVDVVDALAMLKRNVERARSVLRQMIAAWRPAPCSCQRVLDRALVTPPDRIPPSTRTALAPILARRLSAS